MILLEDRVWSYRTSDVKCNMRVIPSGERTACVPLLRNLGDYFTGAVQLMPCFAGGCLADRAWRHCSQLKLLIQVYRRRRERHGRNAGEITWVGGGRWDYREKSHKEHGRLYKEGITCESVYFGLSVFQPVQLKQYKLDMFPDGQN